jgi:hypothetical protein
MTKRDELENRITELTVENAISKLQATNAELLAALNKVIGSPAFWESTNPLRWLAPELRAIVNKAEAAIAKATE